MMIMIAATHRIAGPAGRRLTDLPSPEVLACS